MRATRRRSSSSGSPRRPEVRSAITARASACSRTCAAGCAAVARGLDTVLENAGRDPAQEAAPRAAPDLRRSGHRAFWLWQSTPVWSMDPFSLISAAIAFLVTIFDSGNQNAGTAGDRPWRRPLVADRGRLPRHPLVGCGAHVRMSFLAIRILVGGRFAGQAGPAIRRPFWLLLAALPLFLGYWGVLFEPRAPRLARPQGRDRRLLRGPGAGQGPGLAGSDSLALARSSNERAHQLHGLGVLESLLADQ